MNFDTLAQQIQGQTLDAPKSGNQRAYADLIEESACLQAQTVYGLKFVPARSVRSPEDFTIVENNRTLYVDVKTRQLGTDFNMPNLISVDRLDKILSSDNTDLYYWMIDYRVQDSGQCVIEHSEIRAVWTMPWAALAIQNLGKGQLQIKDWTAMPQQYVGTRETWLADLRTQRRQFYLKQAQKFQKMADKIRV